MKKILALWVVFIVEIIEMEEVGPTIRGTS